MYERINLKEVQSPSLDVFKSPDGALVVLCICMAYSLLMALKAKNAISKFHHIFLAPAFLIGLVALIITMAITCLGITSSAISIEPRSSEVLNNYLDFVLPVSLGFLLLTTVVLIVTNLIYSYDEAMFGTWDRKDFILKATLICMIFEASNLVYHIMILPDYTNPLLYVLANVFILVPRMVVMGLSYYILKV